MIVTWETHAIILVKLYNLGGTGKHSYDRIGTKLS